MAKSCSILEHFHYTPMLSDSSLPVYWICSVRSVDGLFHKGGVGGSHVACDGDSEERTLCWRDTAWRVTGLTSLEWTLPGGEVGGEVEGRAWATLGFQGCQGQVLSPFTSTICQKLRTSLKLPPPKKSSRPKWLHGRIRSNFEGGESAGTI